MFHVKQSSTQFYSLTPGSEWTGGVERLRELPDGLTPASGYAVDVAGERHHLGKVSLARARRFAMARGDFAEISEAVGVADADQLIWRKLETIDRESGGRILRSDGEFMIKQSPEAQVEEQTDKYAAALLAAYIKWAKGQMREYLDLVDVDWYDVKDIDAVFEQAGAKAITDGKDQKSLSAAWGAAALLYLQQAAAQAREFTKNTFLPKIGSSITEGDRVAMKALSEMPGFFIRDHLGNVSKGLTKRGRSIVKAGMRDSLGYREIGKGLRDQLPGMWAKYGKHYADVVANAGVQRARAFAEISAYVEGSIEYAELVAVLDQRTTDCCFFGDTKITIPSGSKRIDQVFPGDVVMTGSETKQRVLGVLKRKVKKILMIALSSGNQIMVTSNHPILTSRGWISAGCLKKGDSVATKRRQKIRGLDNENLQTLYRFKKDEADETQEKDYRDYLSVSGEPVTVESVESISGLFEVYNLEIENDPTYIANGIICHNCRFLDGQFISVSNVVEILNQTLEITNPEEIRRVTPWVYNKKDPNTGMPQLVTRNGVVLADILRSGYGKIDDRGEYAARKMGDQLAVDASIGPPPYHGFCRTTMNPVIRSFSAPAGTWRQAIPTVPPKTNEASTLTTASALRGLTVAASVGAVASGNRPAISGELPTEDKPVIIGEGIDQETEEYAEDGWIEDQKVDVQVNLRVANAMTRLQNALNELYRANNRRDMSPTQKGKLLKDIFRRRIAELRSGINLKLEKADLTFQSVDRLRGDMPQAEADKIRRYALSYLSERMLKVVKRRKLLRIVYNRSPKGRPVGHWDRMRNVFYLPKMESAKAQAIILRVFAHYFDTFGHNGDAAVAAMRDSLASDVIFQYNETMFSDVATPSIYAGRLYNEPGMSEWTAAAFEALALPTNLGFLWDIAPKHVAFLLAYVEGKFV